MTMVKHHARKLRAAGLGPGSGGPRGDLFRARLTDDQVLDIRRRWEQGEALASIAKRHGISIPYASMIGNGLRRRRVADIP